MSNPYIEKIIEISNGSKYVEYYLNIIERAEQRVSNRQQAKEMFGYVESHHILPRSFGLGGDTDPVNIVHLSAREHFVCHLLLTKMVTGIRYYQMLSTLNLFRKRRTKITNYDLKLTSWEYEKIRKSVVTATKFKESREVSIDNVVYPSAKEAKAKTGIPNLHGKLHSAEYPNYFYTDGLTQKVMPNRKHKWKNPVIADGNTYESISEACRVLGLTRSCVESRIRDINYPTYVMEGVQKIDPKKNVYEQPGRPVVIDGKVYKTVSEAARVVGLARQVLGGRLTSKYWPTWYYQDSPKERVSYSAKEAHLKACGKQISVCGKMYPSVSHAARALGMSREQIKYRIKNINYPEYSVLTA